MEIEKINYKDIKYIKAKEEELGIRNLSGYKEEWLNSISPENNKISLYFPKWDRVVRGKLRGKLIVTIGYGGTKKSMLGQLITKINADAYNNRTLYSSMEMGATELINRFIDMTYEYEFNASEYFEKLYKTDANMVDGLYDNFSKVYKNNIFITEKSSMDSELYDKCLTHCNNNGKKIDILIIDGLSMMGGKGTENEIYSRHSKELKDLAKKWNILVMLISHVSRGGERSDKDLSKYIRGSEKILDNCDYYISVSEIKNDEDGGDEYLSEYNNFRLKLKRGKGIYIDVLSKFNPKRLLMEEQDVNALDRLKNKELYDI